MKTLIDALNWRYATKKFTHATLNENELDQILEAARLAPTSFGLQPFEILVIEDTLVREDLAAVSMGQRKVAESSHLVVFATYSTFDESQVRNYLNLAESVRGKDHPSLQGMKETLTSFIQTQEPNWLHEWAKRQTYIALGALLCACAIAEVDACPMEGFKTAAYDKILDLESRNLAASVIVAMGRRHPEDSLAGANKIRKPFSELIRKI